MNNDAQTRPGDQSDMKGLLKRYLDSDLSRRGFLSKLTTLGLSTVVANAVAKEFSPFVTRINDSAVEAYPEWMKPVTGSGGHLLVAQLKAAGVEYIFLNASTGEAPVLDALIDEPSIQIIKSIHEGNLVAMADGYARATGKTPFVMCARPGLPNAMTMMYNAWKDRVPMVVMVDDVSMGMAGQDGFEAMDHMSSMTQTMTKWHWTINSTAKIPEITRRAFKFASTQPGGPVFIGVPEDLLKKTATSAIIEQEKFTLPMRMGADPDVIKQTASLLLAAKNPLILVGDEIGYCQAETELVNLAELLGIPVSKLDYISWSKPFPTQHPLYIGNYLSTSRFPGKVDVLLNLGSRMPLAWGDRFQVESQVKVIQYRLDPQNLGRVYPSELAMVADLRIAIAELIEEVRRQVPARTLKRDAAKRTDRSRKYNEQREGALRMIASKHWDDSPVSGERIINELNALLDKDTVIVSENDTYHPMIEQYFKYGPQDKGYFCNAGFALGWGLPAALGVKLALPDRPVVALVSDGSFLFSGPQPLWTYSRYRAPIIAVVMNNRSYNNERNRNMQMRSRSFETGQDMACYLGDPDVNYVQLANGFGVEGEIIDDAASIKPAVQRAQKATREGRAYLLDVHVARTGTLASSTWHPEYSISSLRTRAV